MSTQLLREIEANHVKSQQDISLARSQLASKQREKRLAQLTSTEISSLNPGTPLYEGVGKMWVAFPGLWALCPESSQWINECIKLSE